MTNSYDHPEVYKELGVTIKDLGCVMLEVENIELPDLDWYYSDDPNFWWIKGPVGSKGAHCTLLYGLMQPAYTWSQHCDRVLDGWTPEPLEIEDVSYFDAPGPLRDEYYCIIGKVTVSDNLLEGHQRLELLPHINTFDYKPHVTLGYVKGNEEGPGEVLRQLDHLPGTYMPVKGISYGDKKLV